ncbi:MAG: type II toxin-antitoxin system RelE/ParE family toxin [Chthoniobacter sp.]|nr:type II toxin-antitoxin system RelE/ParE family toxin [Chthoniobacter sp.]
MTYRVVYSPRSERDLEKIRTWIVGESASVATATRFLGQLFDACDSLAALPQRFAVYPYARNWRMMPFGNYLVFFQIHEDEVRIGHIRHGARRPFSGDQ